MQLCFVVGELLQLQHHCLFVLLGLNEICLSFSLAFRFVHDIFGFGLDAAVRVFYKIFISFLSISDPFFGAWGKRGLGGVM